MPKRCFAGKQREREVIKIVCDQQRMIKFVPRGFLHEMTIFEQTPALRPFTPASAAHWHICCAFAVLKPLLIAHCFTFCTSTLSGGRAKPHLRCFSQFAACLDMHFFMQPNKDLPASNRPFASFARPIPLIIRLISASAAISVFSGYRFGTIWGAPFAHAFAFSDCEHPIAACSMLFLDIRHCFSFW